MTKYLVYFEVLILGVHISYMGPQDQWPQFVPPLLTNRRTDGQTEGQTDVRWILGYVMRFAD